MRAILKGVLITALFVAFAAGAHAEDEPTYTTQNENISFNYGNNTFDVTDGAVDSNTELTVMLVKGDYTTASLAEISSEDIYYIGQASGTNYKEVFSNIGVKYDNGKFRPGVYTMVTSGYGMAATKTKVVIGNATTSSGEGSEYLPITLEENTGIKYGSVTDTFRVYEADDIENYVYVAVGNFNIEDDVASDKLGFVVQKAADNKVVKGYQSLQKLGLDLGNIASISGVLEVGIQLNDIPNNTEIVAIPYVDASAASLVE